MNDSKVKSSRLNILYNLVCWYNIILCVIILDFCLSMRLIAPFSFHFHKSAKFFSVKVLCKKSYSMTTCNLHQIPSYIFCRHLFKISKQWFNSIEKTVRVCSSIVKPKYDNLFFKLSLCNRVTFCITSWNSDICLFNAHVTVIFC